jgi:intraflagellar transport protein 80
MLKVEVEAPGFGKLPQVKSFCGNHVTVRHADGSTLTSSVSPYARMLFDFITPSTSRWEEAVRLCRLVESRPLWAALTAMAIHGRHLDTAEITLAAIDAVDKLNHILYIKDIPSEKGKVCD